MAEADWAKVAIDAAISLASGLGGLALGIWKWGRNSEKSKQAVKDDYNGKITALREETRVAMAKNTENADARNSLLVEQFKETLEGLRRQMDESKLHTEQNFLRKEDFREFLKEYREDTRRADTKLDRLLETRQ
ncbi:hypothetical protein IVB46_10135 [Bradyrhizobium sp. 61]|uniref:hypothetical protein n=1 Tax=Bradyrhizobium sp. 61 TaxID=2782679 RepID=UPI001FF9C391|nr:hypothetical protein [Bradyrhizobium sp. 61]MCK1275589.1 hypothetical protein [Bradyrhizobium sp. 61]